MAEPRKLSNWLAAAKAAPTRVPAGPSSPEQLSKVRINVMLFAFVQLIPKLENVMIW